MEGGDWEEACEDYRAGYSDRFPLDGDCFREEWGEIAQFCGWTLHYGF